MNHARALTLPAPATRSAPVWVPVALGLLLLYVPTYRDLAAVFSDGERGSQGLVVLVMWAWLLWRERPALRADRRAADGSALGWVLLAVGAALYALGRSQRMLQLEVGSQLVVLPGIALVLLGPASTRRLWFVFAFLVFTVPLPGSLVDAVLVPLKELVSAAVTEILFFAGLPIARDGVVIYVGPYQLFIADACSGLNQLVALAAVGALYVRVAGHRSFALNSLLLVAILPVALAANLARVLALVLATYYGGDGLGRDLHDYMGYAEIGIAFGAFFLLDRRRAARSAARAPMSPLARGVLVAAVLIARVLCGGSAHAAHRGRDRPRRSPREFPSASATWTAEPQSAGPGLARAGCGAEADAAQIAAYDDVLMRTYRRADGARVMAAFAYGRSQTQELKIHRPELCYSRAGLRRERRSGHARCGSTADAPSSRRAAHAQSRADRGGHVLDPRRRARRERPVGHPLDDLQRRARRARAGRLLVRASSLAESRAGAEHELALAARVPRRSVSRRADATRAVPRRRRRRRRL